MKNLGLTIKDIYNANRLAQQDYIKNYNTYLEADKKRYLAEQSKLNSYQACSNKKEKEQVRIKLQNLNWKVIAESEFHRFYDSEVAKDLLCLINATLWTPPQTLAPLGFNRRVHDYISNIVPVGVSSAFGLATFSDWFNTKRTFVIKASRRRDDHSLVHEAFVGLYGTNKLRMLGNYNFALVLGAFKCSEPVDVDSEIISYCRNNPNEKVDYLIYENIFPSISLRNAIPSLTVTEWLEIYFQLLVTLHYAFDVVGFTHYDLHTENVLLRKLPEKKVLEYNFNNGPKISFYANYVVTIIDYGKARIIVDGQSYGSTDPETNSALGFPLQDAFRLLYAAMADAFKTNRSDLVHVMQQQFRFFLPNDDIFSVDKMLQTKPNFQQVQQLLPLLPMRMPIMNNEALASYMQYMYQLYHTQMPNVRSGTGFTGQPKLVCDGQCHGFLHEVLETAPDRITFYGFLDGYYVLDNPAAREQWIKNFNYPAWELTAVARLTRDYNEVISNTAIARNKVFVIDRNNFNELTAYGRLSNFANLVIITNSYNQRLANDIEVAHDTAQLTKQKFNAEHGNLLVQQTQSTLNTWSQNIKEDVAWVLSLQKLITREVYIKLLIRMKKVFN